MTNYAFIDAQNLHKGVEHLGWKLNYQRFRVYLKEKYQVEKSYLFMGFVPEHQDVYEALEQWGYVLVFKPILEKAAGGVKGNVDADLVLQTMIDWPEYDRAVIVTSDGDFQSLVDYLYGQHKLEILISPNWETCSILLKKAARERIVFLNNLKRKLAYIQKRKHHKKEALLKDDTFRNASSS